MADYGYLLQRARELAGGDPSVSGVDPILNFMLPETMSLIRGEPARKIPNVPEFGKVPMSEDPRIGGSMLEVGSTLFPTPTGAAAPLFLKAMAAGVPGAARKLAPGMLRQLTGKDAAKDFHAAVASAKAAHPQGAAVELKSVEDYAAEGVKLFTTPDNTVGFAIKKDGDLVSVFKHPASTYTGAGPVMAERAVSEGAKKLDAFDTVLPTMYGTGGFRAVGRIPFNPKFKPEGWRVKDFPFPGTAPSPTGEIGRKGRPDVVAMVADPAAEPYVPGAGLPTHGYDNLMRLQELAMQGREPTAFVPTARRAITPDVYRDPRDIAADAAKAYSPEDPALHRLFNVHRDDLLGMAQDRVRDFGEGYLPPPAGMNTGPRARGSPAMAELMTPANAQRILDVIEETRKLKPELVEGMLAWSVQDPMFWRMIELGGHKKALRDYPFLNTMQAIMSPGSNVPTEISRGSAAAMLARQGRAADFLKYAGSRNPASESYVPGAPADMADIPGHIYHPTAHSSAMEKFLREGKLTTEEVKVPTYAGATGVPQTGYSWAFPIGDTHFDASLGLPDVRAARKLASQKGSISPSELSTLAPWFRREISSQLGWTPAQTQHVQWAAFGPQTGVDTALGAPKLELQAKQIMKRAEKLGMSPEKVRDLGLQFKQHWIWPFVAGGALLPGEKEDRERKD